MTSPNNTPQATELLPCPFCGGAPVIVEHQSHAHSAMLKALVPGIPDHSGSWSIECCDVGMIKATRDEVVAAWNRRASSIASCPVATWQDRMPAPRFAYQCSMNCSTVGMAAIRGEDCGDCMPITIHGDTTAARDAEIAALRAIVAMTGAANTGSLLAALKGETPLVEPVYIGKALRAGREARAVLSGGTGPLACVMLVNIQLSPWIYNEDTAKAFADGYNTALNHLRGAVLEVVENDGTAAKNAGAQA